MSQSETGRKVIEDYYAAIRDNDREAWLSLFDESAITYCPVGEPANHGEEAIGKFFDTLIGHFTKVEIYPNFYLARGLHGSAHWNVMCETADGKRVEMEGLDSFLLDEDGKIVNMHGYWDPEELLAALS
ncbi:MAG: nuclear transport factor 2 family protein [Candidatus Lindowbacteria bacterium]|nr:nuclear transport factor 2 family protein [Candidatus Lindowbacteria bacterium]